MAWVLLVLVSVGLANSAWGWVVLNDTFDLPVGTATRADDPSDMMDTAWYAVTGTPAYLDQFYDAVWGSRVMRTQGSGPVPVGAFPLVTLSNVGDYITLSLDKRFDRTYPVGSLVFCFGLYDNGGTVVGGDGQNGQVADDKGYFALFESGADNYTALKQENPAGTAICSGSSDHLGNVSLANQAFINDQVHRVALTVKRTATGVNVSLAVDGVVVMTKPDSGGLMVTTFNQIAIRNTFYGDTSYDNIRVETNAGWTLEGTANVANLAAGNLKKVGLWVELRQDGNLVWEQGAFPDATGYFVLNGFTPPGYYHVTVKPYAHLQQVFPSVEINGSANLGTINLTAGDCDGDNAITSTDLSIVLGNME